MTVMGDPTMSDGTFDFDRYDAPEDIVVRTVDGLDEDRWVDLLVTPHGRICLWGFSDTAFDTAEEAISWAKTTIP